MKNIHLDVQEDVTVKICHASSKRGSYLPISIVATLTSKPNAACHNLHHRISLGGLLDLLKALTQPQFPSTVPNLYSPSNLLKKECKEHIKVTMQNMLHISNS